MRRTLTLCRTGLAGAAAFVLLTASSGGSDDSASSSSSASGTTSSSSSSSSSAPAADSEFCQQAGAVLAQLNSVTTVPDPAQIAPILQQAATQLDAIEPPQQITSDWNSLVGAIQQLAQAASATDFTNQQQATAFAQTLSQLSSQLQGPSTNVENYLSTQCGISSDDTASSAPTS